jgi:sialate O-acetylesterase
MQRILLLVGLMVCALAAPVDGALSMPFVFTDHAVLQRDMPVPVWGSADPGQNVRIQFAGQDKTVTAAQDGKWAIKLDPMPASAEGRTLVISSGRETLKLDDVLVGEVWLCSGQSNMDKPLGERRRQKPTVNYKQEIAAADFPHIRLLKVPRPRQHGAGTQWEVCSPKSIAGMPFSAIGYFFARKLNQELKVPIGMIQSSVGGTRIEAWTSPEGFAQVPSLAEWASAASAPHPRPFQKVVPSSLYRAMIQPLIPFAIRGSLWYQGAANVWMDDGMKYNDKMHALIGGWRSAWGEGEFPFYFVQLAPYRYTARPDHHVPADALCRIWEAQTASLEIPNTAMIVTNDLVTDFNDIHPTRKREVAERLADCALARDYGRKDLTYQGPTFKSVSFKGSDAIITFDHVAGGLKSRDGKPLTDFTIAGADERFLPAEARVEHDRVIVSSPKVSDPKFIRFAWNETATPNLVNSAALPAGPFRTDRLPPAPLPPEK